MYVADTRRGNMSGDLQPDYVEVSNISGLKMSRRYSVRDPAIGPVDNASGNLIDAREH